MEFVEVGELFSNIDAAIEQEQFDTALQLILANFDALPDPAALRERTAAILGAEGDVDAAVDIYEKVGTHYLNGGHPARVIAVLKKLERLGRSRPDLLDRFTALYNVRSPFLDRSRRHAALGTHEEDNEVVVHAEEIEEPVEKPLEVAKERALEAGEFVEEPPDDLPPLPLLSQFASEPLAQVVRQIEFTTYDDLQQVSGPDASDGQLLWTVSPDLTIGDDDPTYRLRPGSLLGLHTLTRPPLRGEQEVFARSGSELLMLSDESVDQLSQTLDTFRDAVLEVARRSLIEGLLERHSMFDMLPKEEREEFLSQFVGLELAEGTILIEQSAESPGLFLILDGECDLVRRDEDWEITIQTLDSGDVVGEVGLVSDRPSPTDVLVTEPAHVLHLPAEAFDSVASQHPELAKWAVGLAQNRIEEMETTLSAQDLAEISE